MAAIIQHPIISDSNTATILFSIKSKKYSFLSNLYCSDMTIDSKLYYHVEGYYQSQRYSGIDDKAAEHIRNIVSPILANKAVTKYLMSNDREIEWKTGLKNSVMKRAIFVKFLTNSELAKKLVDTGDAILIENNPNDPYWSGGIDGKGDNNVGKILMEVRDVLRTMY